MERARELGIEEPERRVADPEVKRELRESTQRAVERGAEFWGGASVRG